MKKWENFSKEELEQFVKDSTSYAQVCEKIGYKGGSGQKAVKDMIELYSLIFLISKDKVGIKTISTMNAFVMVTISKQLKQLMQQYIYEDIIVKDVGQNCGLINQFLLKFTIKMVID